MGGSVKLLAGLYAALGLVYIIHSGVDIKGITIDNWLVKNYHFIHLLVGTLYASIAIVYLYDSDADKKKVKRFNSKHFIIGGIVLFVLYIWIALIRKTPTSSLKTIRFF